jgi:hypothetical protein
VIIGMWIARIMTGYYVLLIFHIPCLCISIFVEQVVLPEGSKDIEVSAPFPTQQRQEVISRCVWCSELNSYPIHCF